MCLAKLYEESPAGEKLIQKNVVTAVHDTNSWTFTDLLGRSVKVEGMIESINFDKSVIKIIPASYQKLNRGRTGIDS